MKKKAMEVDEDESEEEDEDEMETDVVVSKVRYANYSTINLDTDRATTNGSSTALEYKRKS